MFKQTANQSTASSGHQQELAPLESGPLQLSSFDPYTHNLEDLELQLSPLFNVTVPNDLSIPQPPPLLPIPHPRPSSPQHVKPEGRRCGRGHLHAPWPRFGRLEIRKCETFCWYCGLTVQSAATLRKHVQNQHQKKGSMQIEVAASTSGRRRQDLTDIIGSHIPTPDRDPPSVTSLGGGITEPQAAQGHSDLACSSLGLSRLQDPMLAPPLVVDDIYPGVLDLSHTDTDSKEKRVFSSNPSPNRGITQRKRPDSPGPPSQHFTYVSKPELQTLQEEARVLRRQKTSMVQFAQQLQSENFALYSQMTGFRRQYYRRQESIHRIFSTLDLSEATRQIVEQSSTFFVQVGRSLPRSLEQPFDFSFPAFTSATRALHDRAESFCILVRQFDPKGDMYCINTHVEDLSKFLGNVLMGFQELNPQHLDSSILPSTSHAVHATRESHRLFSTMNSVNHILYQPRFLEESMIWADLKIQIERQVSTYGMYLSEDGLEIWMEESEILARRIYEQCMKLLQSEEHSTEALRQ